MCTFVLLESRPLAEWSKLFISLNLPISKSVLSTVKIISRQPIEWNGSHAMQQKHFLSLEIYDGAVPLAFFHSYTARVSIASLRRWPGPS